MKLLILESPGKVKKVQSFLGDDWKVVASVGHVRDLPERELGVAIPDFVPEYIPTERGKGVLKKIKDLAKTADSVYLATDPDREGEAIAWHIVDALNLPSPKRITYGEITESAIKNAISSPRNLDMSLVKAQEARRILDRLCGYMVSGTLSKVAQKKLSAGRVQSPAVRLVVERERAIEEFVPTTHYGAVLTLQNESEGSYKAIWLSKSWHEGDYLLDKELAEKVATIRSLTVQSCKETKSSIPPPAPFTTSSLQQAASNSLGFTPKHTMSITQKLYEQGHITYMRTDSPNLSDEAVQEIRDFCTSQGWSLVAKPRTWKSKQGAQEAHEAIRPTHFDVADAGESEDERALYTLIRIRTLATQLQDAVYDVRTLQLAGQFSADLDRKSAITAQQEVVPFSERNKNDVFCEQGFCVAQDVRPKSMLFEAKGRTVNSLGWKVLMQNDVATQDLDDEEEANYPVPKLIENSSVTATSGAVQTKKTKAPSRFTEASLVRELENRGIGRPATFASIIDTIKQRGYVRVEKKNLMPTEIGLQVVALLSGTFSFVDYSFTRTMEDHLDELAKGKISYKEVVSVNYEVLQEELAHFVKQHPQKEKATPDFSPFNCDECGKPLLRLKGKRKDGKGNYDFFVCSDRECDTKYHNKNGTPCKPTGMPVFSEHICECGKPLVERTGAKGAFFGCSAYPKCKNTYQIDENGKPQGGKG